MSTISLYELTTQYQQLADMEITEPEDFDAFEELLADLSDGIQAKAVSIGHVIKGAEYTCEVMKAEEKRIADRRRAAERKIERLKGYLLDGMTQSGVLDIRDPVMPLKVVKNPPAVEVTEESLIPDRFFVPQPPKLDKNAVKAVLKAGEEVPGAVLRESQRVRIG